MENLSDLVPWIALAIALAVAGWNLYQRKGQTFNITLPDILEATGEVIDLAPTLEEVVEDAVYAAEQFKKTGKLVDNNKALDYAIAYIAKFFPDADPDIVRAKIEKYVFLAHQYVKE